jgi:hypothetical protein
VNPARLRAALVISAIALGSALAGAAVDHWIVRHARHRGRFDQTPEEQERRRKEMLARMTKELDLSTAQRAGIDSVMQRTDSALGVVRSAMQPQLRQIFESSRAEISARLDSTQRVKFEKMRPPKRGHGRSGPVSTPPAGRSSGDR